MLALIATCLVLGCTLSFRINVVLLCIIAAAGSLVLAGVSAMLGYDATTIACRVVISVVCLEAGYFIGIVVQAASRASSG